MKILQTFSEAAAYFKGPTAVTIGVFDGVHLGHQKLLTRTHQEALAQGIQSLAITFREHPLALLAPPYAPRRLTTPQQKIKLIKSLGIDAVLELNFDQELAATQPDDFVKRYLLEACRAKVIVCGYDFTFGHQGRGNIDLMRSIAPINGAKVLQEEACTIDGIAVKSTHIRDLLFEGKIQKANRLLSRPYELQGQVVTGHARGRTIGYPTANLELPETMALPAAGVYYCTASIDETGTSYVAMVNIGVSPTFGQNPKTIEAHLLDFNGDLLGRSLTLNFHQRLRDEKKFPSVDALVEQLQQDEANVRTLSQA